jgi:SAM-dependent methyltransferase
MLREDILETHVDLAASFQLSNQQRKALEWLSFNVLRGATVLDIGTGPGQFLDALKNRGFVPLGLDVAESPVQMLRKLGYQVWHGTSETLPLDLSPPAACTVFNVLHHMPLPLSFLSNLKTKFPDAVLIVGQYDTFDRVLRSKRMHWTWFPPRTYNYWSPLALRRALEKTGYRVEMAGRLRKTLAEYSIPGSQRLYFRFRKQFRKLLPIYYAAKAVVLPSFIRDRFVGKDSERKMLAIGRPN